MGTLSTDFGSHHTTRPNAAGGGNYGNVGVSPPDKDPKVATEASRKFDLTSAVNQSYNRAANLLCEALGAIGVAFVDAGHISSTTTATQRRSSTPSDEITGAATSTDTDTDASDSGTTVVSKMCKVTGISTFTDSEDDSTARFELSKRDLSTLAEAYPRARVFSFTRGGNSYSSSEASGPGSCSDSSPDRDPSRVKTQHGRNARILENVVGKGSSIMFYPIFDAKRWRSALIIWAKASSVSRFFDQHEDVNYCSAFAHSLRADLARIETAASDAAKGTFIPSISHELRNVGLRQRTFVYQSINAGELQDVSL